MTYDQIAGAVSTSAATVHRDIRLARAWLLNEIGGHATRDDSPRPLATDSDRCSTSWSTRTTGDARQRLATRLRRRLGTALIRASRCSRSDATTRGSAAARHRRGRRIAAGGSPGPIDRDARRPVSRGVDSRPWRHEHRVSRRTRRRRNTSKPSPSRCCSTRRCIPGLRSRLHSERHILATLDHPSIARLIDSGELEDGTPYLVMEHVDGESIDVYCDSRTLFVRERLELFIQVCAAVQYAHRNLVVHRDIKPRISSSPDEGAPKLLDFGIAKLLAPESLSHTLPVTRLQERILTPENAAPEQVLGRPITTATDIYALGVLLYQLLTGRSPYRLLSYSQLQLERAICMDDPVRPSQMVVSKLSGETDADRSRISDRRGLSPQRLRARLSGDLDAIVAMAMRKEPDRRYPSVEALADDLSRHLLGQPVRARHGDWRYNTRQISAAACLGAVAVVAAAFVGLALFARRHDAGRTIASNWRARRPPWSATERNRYRRSWSMCSRRPTLSMRKGKEPTAKDLLDRGARKDYRQSRACSRRYAPSCSKASASPTGARACSERAIPLFEQAVAIRRQERPLDNGRIAVALANLARALTDAGHLISAEADFEQAVALSRKRRPITAARNSRHPGAIRQFCTGCQERSRHVPRKLFGKALVNLPRPPSGNQNLQAASTLERPRLDSRMDERLRYRRALQREALSIFQRPWAATIPIMPSPWRLLGSILTQRGKYAEAEQVLERSPGNRTQRIRCRQPRIAAIEADLGILYDREGDTSRAIAATQTALQITRDRRGPTTTWRATTSMRSPTCI